MWRPSLVDHLSALDNWCQQGKVLYPLPEITLLVRCATQAGAESLGKIRPWGRHKPDTLAPPLVIRAGHSRA
jgi:hypothetical protein